MKTTAASEFEERLAVAEAAVEEALRERNRLWEQLNRQRADQRELEHLHAELRAVRASPLWRLAGLYQRARAFVLAGWGSLRRL
jgi:hypothetical protein